MKLNPTPKQKKLLDFIKEHIAATGVSPSYEQMKLAMGLKSRHPVFQLVHRLMERGQITMIAGKPRSIVVL